MAFCADFLLHRCCFSAAVLMLIFCCIDVGLLLHRRWFFAVQMLVFCCIFGVVFCWFYAVCWFFIAVLILFFAGFMLDRCWFFAAVLVLFLLQLRCFLVLFLEPNHCCFQVQQQGVKHRLFECVTLFFGDGSSHLLYIADLSSFRFFFLLKQEPKKPKSLCLLFCKLFL